MTSAELLAAYVEMDSVPYERKPIPNFPGYAADTEGHIWFEDIKIETYINGGYNKFSAYVNGRQSQQAAHVLVCSAFYGPRPEGLLALHKDDIRTNDVPSNLYWGTGSENGLDAYRNGKITAVGSENGASKLDEDDVRVIKRRLLAGELQVNLAKEFNVAKATIWCIKAGINWKEVK